MGPSGRIYIAPDMLVEAAGVEPASVNGSGKASTCVDHRLDSSRARRRMIEPPRPPSLWCLAPSQEASAGKPAQFCRHPSTPPWAGCATDGLPWLGSLRKSEVVSCCVVGIFYGASHPDTRLHVWPDPSMPLRSHLGLITMAVRHETFLRTCGEQHPLIFPLRASREKPRPS